MRRRWLSLADDALDAALLLGTPGAAVLVERAERLWQSETTLRTVIKDSARRNALQRRRVR